MKADLCHKKPEIPYVSTLELQILKKPDMGIEVDFAQKPILNGLISENIEKSAMDKLESMIAPNFITINLVNWAKFFIIYLN